MEWVNYVNKCKPISLGCIKRFYVRPIYDPALWLLRSTSNPLQGNQSNLSITKARFEQLSLNLSISCLTSLHPDPQQKSAIDLVTHRSLI